MEILGLLKLLRETQGIPDVSKQLMWLGGKKNHLQ